MEDVILDAGLRDGRNGTPYLSRYTQFPDGSVAPYTSPLQCRTIPFTADPNGVLVQHLDTSPFISAFVTINLHGVGGNLSVQVLADGQEQRVPCIWMGMLGSLGTASAPTFQLGPSLTGEPSTVYLPVLGDELNLSGLDLGGHPTTGWDGQVLLIPGPLPFSIPVPQPSQTRLHGYIYLEQNGPAEIVYTQACRLFTWTLANAMSETVLLCIYDKATVPNPAADVSTRAYPIAPGDTHTYTYPDPGLQLYAGLGVTFTKANGQPLTETSGVYLALEYIYMNA